MGDLADQKKSELRSCSTHRVFFWTGYSVGASLSGCTQQRMRKFTVLILKETAFAAFNDGYKLQHSPMNLWFIE
jgi:hypothetical protein